MRVRQTPPSRCPTLDSRLRGNDGVGVREWRLWKGIQRGYGFHCAVPPIGVDMPSSVLARSEGWRDVQAADAVHWAVSLSSYSGEMGNPEELLTA